MAYSIGGAGRSPFGPMGPTQGPMGMQLPALPLPAETGSSPAEAAYRAEIAKALEAERGRYKADPFDTLLNFGLGAMAASSQPGANLFSAIGQGGLSAMQANRAARGEFLRDQQLEAQDRAARIGLLGQVAAGERPKFESVRDIGLVQTNAPGGPRVALPVGKKDTGPNSEIAKLRADLTAGLITEADFRTGAARLERQALAPIEQAAVAAGLTPGTPQYQDFVRQATLKPQTEVKLPTQEKAEGQAEGKRLVDEFQSVAARADNAQNELNNLRVARSVATSSNLPTELQATVGRVASSLGIPLDGTTTKALFGNQDAGQAFVGTMQNLVLTKMQAQKGPQTENDAKRIEKTVASLGNTPQARDFLMRTAESLAERDVAQRAFYEDWKAEKGTYDGAARAWRTGPAQMPIVGTNRNNKLPVFFTEFQRGMRQANPGITESQIMERWKAGYE